MNVPRRLSAVLLFAAASLLALVFSGLLDWITGLLFLTMEFLADCLRTRVDPRRKHRQHVVARGRPPSGAPAHGRDRHHRPSPRKAHPRHGHHDPDQSTGGDDSRELARRCRVLVPLSADRPGLVAFALDECRGRHAELLLLFLRPLAVTPMGPNQVPGLAEDDQARDLFERIGEEASEAGVPLRTFYEVTRDLPGTILEVARAQKADVLVMEATRRNLLWRAFLGDVIQSILVHLPERVSLVIHSP